MKKSGKKTIITPRISMTIKLIDIIPSSKPVLASFLLLEFSPIFFLKINLKIIAINATGITKFVKGCIIP